MYMLFCKGLLVWLMLNAADCSLAHSMLSCTPHAGVADA
jgi:hypothetical protein